MTTPIDDLRVTRNNDKRIKLTETQRTEIAARKGESIHALSREYDVSRRLIQFIQYPERIEKNKRDRQGRGGWRQYYDTAKHREQMQGHRDYKRELVKEGKI